MTFLRPNEALAEGVQNCAMLGTTWRIINSEEAVVWDIAPDTKVDEEDLAYPVIVHMRGGTVTDDSIVILIEAGVS